MLAAMTTDARRRYNNRVNLLAGGVSPWTVPAGVTSVNVFAAARGGSAVQAFLKGAVGGGGGAAILNIPLTVTPADTLTVTFNDNTFWWSWDVADSTGTLFTLETGRDAQGANAGTGGSVYWLPGGFGASAAGGTGYGTPNGRNGDNGARTAFGGGWLLGGGGGGNGNTLFPAAQGGSGGSSGDFAGITDPTPAGGGGGGFFPGLYYRDNVTLTPNGYQSSFIFLEWD
jgi:hypothetical protein